MHASSRIKIYQNGIRNKDNAASYYIRNRRTHLYNVIKCKHLLVPNHIRIAWQEKGEANICRDDFELFISRSKNDRWIDEIKWIFIMQNTNFYASDMAPKWNVKEIFISINLRLSFASMSTILWWILAPKGSCSNFWCANWKQYFSGKTRRRNVMVILFWYSYVCVCHVIFHAYFNFTYAIPGDFTFGGCGLYRIYVCPSVENCDLSLKISLSKMCKSTLKCDRIAFKRYCMWMLHLSSSWSNSEKKRSTHSLTHPLIHTLTSSCSWCGFDFHFTSPIYWRYNLIGDHFHFNIQSATKNLSATDFRITFVLFSFSFKTSFRYYFIMMIWQHR